MKRAARKQLNFGVTADDVEALAHTIDDVTRMSALDADGGPATEITRKRAIALLRKILGI